MNAVRAANGTAAELDARRMLWRCRRGMKELDLLLERYARAAHAQASAAERRAFAALLELPDPKLADYLFGYDVPADPVVAELARRIACGAFATAERAFEG
jgi:antitoxin CptB